MPAIIANQNLLSQINETLFYKDIDRKNNVYKIVNVKYNGINYDVYVKKCVSEYVGFDMIPVDDYSKQLVKRNQYKWVPNGNTTKFHKRFFNPDELFNNLFYEVEDKMKTQMKEIISMHKSIQNTKSKMDQELKLIDEMDKKMKYIQSIIDEHNNYNKYHDEYVTDLYDNIPVAERIYIDTDGNIGQYPFTEFINKGAHHDPLGGWFTNPQNLKLIHEYPTFPKLTSYDVKNKIEFEEKRKEFIKTLCDNNTKIVYV